MILVINYIPYILMVSPYFFKKLVTLIDGYFKILEYLKNILTFLLFYVDYLFA